MAGSLFRAEAVEFRRNRAWSGTTIAPPLAMWLLTAFLSASVFAAGIFLSVGTYAEKETVYGYLTPITGIAKLMPAEPGSVAELYVADGETVTAGQRLLLVKTERHGTQGQGVDTAILAGLKAKHAAIADRLDIERHHAAEQRQSLSDALAALEADIATLTDALRTQRQRLLVAHDQVEAVRSTVAKGYTSLTEFRRRQDMELSQRQAETEIYRQIAAKAVEVRAKRYAMAELDTKTADNLAVLRAAMADADASLAEAQARQGYLMTAPIAGRITNLQAWIGMGTRAEVPLLSIVPDHAPLEISLLVPARAAGFIGRGQTVHVAFDAFPFQRFGFYSGTIVSMSDALLKPSETAGPMTVKEASYRATARLDRQTITAYGHEVPLRPDMSLKADIVIDRRSLVQWLFDPLLSARGRM
ncbi:HlyD family efflux transporter periplasmic adaptor subunit [Rhodopila globiformis]|nr:HlyD family efflux transporter periplasmic adaptor subunit [Rhodopila globiformis]